MDADRADVSLPRHRDSLLHCPLEQVRNPDDVVCREGPDDHLGLASHKHGSCQPDRCRRIARLGLEEDVAIRHARQLGLDRGTVRATAIGSGSKLDNMVHIGHNVQVGEDCMLCGQVGIAGSTRIGHRVVLAGQCGVSDNITVGDDVIAAGGTNIYTNVPKGRTIWGSPAVKMETQLEINKSVRRLPRLFAQMAELRETVTKLTQKGGTE